MRASSIIVIVFLTAALVACGGGEKTAPTGDAVAPDTVSGDTLEEAMQNMPDDDAHRGLAMGSGGMGGMMGGAMNREVHVDEAIRAAWSGVRVRVEKLDSGTTETFVAPLGQAIPLGDTGLTLTAEVFVPDFVMDENGITSRSPEPNNPAARVLITEEGQTDFKGWLFASLPEIHPFPHEHYRVTLVEGVPAK